jgi:hypothetical protein
LQGLQVPEVLQPFIGGKTFIPFTKELPKDSSSSKRKQEQKPTGTVKAAVEELVETAQKAMNLDR